MKVMKVLLLLLCFAYGASAQEEPTTPPGTLPYGSVILAQSSDPVNIPGNTLQLWLLDPFTGTQSLYLSLEEQGYQITNIAFPSGGEALFVLSVAVVQNTGMLPLGQSQLMRINLETGEREILFSGVNLTEFTLSPDATKALIRFYPEEMTYADRDDVVMRAEWCVIEFGATQNECRTLQIEGEERLADNFEWMSNDLLAYTLNDKDSIQILDTATFTTEVINLQEGINASEILRIPSTESLLIYDNPSTETESGKLFILDMNSRTVEQIGELNYAFLSIFTISPDGQYAVMGGWAGAIFVDLTNGQIIQTYPTMYDEMEWASIDWLPIEYTSLVIGRLRFRADGVLTTVFEPHFNVAVNILPPLRGQLIVVR